ncbi:MAG TPA: aminotransferase class III-fold pyridoxal phosphate-dependent enzyme [Gaiellaceae bacterium]|jgi:4-aminobutyrate aminotransferase-like enzyme/Ser/Thr protein kinase RdoA (MazF antagonist)|nr:aminotransferase class III-fold pyridoxal phosphate-dependent enzyme [Gaiellaceae bacterium]
MSSVLDSMPPSFSADDVARIAAELFGLEGTATNLGSERDQTFLVEGAADAGVVKLSNLAEDPGTLDLETEAILHISRLDPGLPISRPRVVSAAAGTAAYRTTVEGPDGTHFVRLFERLHGGDGGPDLSDAAVRDYGAMHARLNLALRSFFHPGSGRELLWDLAHAAKLRPLTDRVVDPSRRRLVESVLDRYEANVASRWPRLRAHVVHGDLNLDNVLFDDTGRISGIVDFGDVGHTAQVGDLAIGVASLMRGRPLDDVLRIGRIATDGYQSRIPLEADELDVLGDLVATRLAAIVVISAWRVAQYPENAEYIQAWDEDSWRLLELVGDIGPVRFAEELGAARSPVATDALVKRRSDALGAVLTELSYSDPVHLVRGERAWLIDVDGRRLLDAYNNVPVVGHSHPRVTEAVVRQTRLLNTHARYLYEPLVDLGERLLASMPPEAGLDSVMFVNSGSEANDIAWRIAADVTGRDGAIITQFAYHGVTDAIADLSPEEWPEGFRPSRVGRIPVGGDVKTAVAELAERGHALAATFIDAGLTSDGIHPLTRDSLAEIVQATHDAGGLFVADEVQVGYGRSGEHLWTFAHLGATPDFVTLGKPMGNGYPVAAVLTRREIIDDFAFAGRVFSTFGGNPVAAQAGLAVLDVIRDERVIPQVKRVGGLLRARIEELQGSHPEIVDVRGLGLLIGVQLDDPARAKAVVNAMRERGVLIGRTGPNEDVLKVRPPLVFDDEHVAVLVAVLEESLVAT